MGKYFRDRFNVPHGERVMMEDLVSYGRQSVSVSLLEKGVYFFDFDPANVPAPVI